jgi:hypothetical protein
MREATRSLNAAMRRLWADHVIWTREYIVAAVGDRPEADSAAARLLKNQEDIGNAVVPFYGEEAGSALTDILKQHIMIAVDLVAAARSGDQDAFQQHDAAWDANGREIAAFLSGANPHSRESDVYDLLNQHLTLTMNEAVAGPDRRLARPCEGDAPRPALRGRGSAGGAGGGGERDRAGRLRDRLVSVAG